MIFKYFVCIKSLTGNILDISVVLGQQYSTVVLAAFELAVNSSVLLDLN